MLEDVSDKLTYLRQKQSLPLEAKILIAKRRIRDWYEHWNGHVYVSISGGKDSTVLLDICRKMYPDIPAVFFDTGLAYPEVREFVKTLDNVTWIRPKMTFREVIEKYGYPVISKAQARYIYEYRTTNSEKLRRLRWKGRGSQHKYRISLKWRFMVDAPFKIHYCCCDALKKRPAHIYERETENKPIVGNMASDGNERTFNYVRTGCNAFDSKRPISKPLSVWLEEDVWEYLHRFNVPYSCIYDMGYPRTGCMFCMFGVNQEPEPNRFQRMKQTHPRLWKYCLDELGIREVLEYMGVSYE